MTGRVLAGVAAVVALALASGGEVALATRSAGEPLTREQLLAYEAAIEPIVKDGGKVVQLGMKPAMDDLTNRHVVPAEVIASEADGWARSLAAVRARLSRVPAPPALEPTGVHFLEALDLYAAAARQFADAARASGAGRQAATDRGVDLAVTADRTYDRGAAVLQQARRDLGLGPNPTFPEATDG